MKKYKILAKIKVSSFLIFFSKYETFEFLINAYNPQQAEDMAMDEAFNRRLVIDQNDIQVLSVTLISFK